MPRLNRTIKAQLKIPRVCIVGAGISGICAAVNLKKELNIQSFVIIERNHDVGGVWLTNRYPDLVAQVSFEVFSYSFAPKTNWSKFYSRREEIWNYLQAVAKKYELYPNIRFNTSVKSIQWQENANNWIVKTVNENGEQCAEEYNIVIVATGTFREANKPTKFEAFTGPTMHSAEWNSTIRLENKVVGVVGTGASAVQIIPAIASKVKELIVYQRTPNYCIPRIGQGRVSCLQKLTLRIPGHQNMWRKYLVFQAGLLENVFKNDSVFSKLCGRVQKAYLFHKVKDETLRRQLTPNYPLGAKFFNVSGKFYECLQRPNVKLITEPILNIDENTISTQDGQNNKLDVLILCTGFKQQSFFSPIEIIGINETNLLTEWTREWPKTYYGVTCHLAPNMVFLAGPNTGMLTSVFCLVEWQCKFLVNIIKIMINRNLTFFQVKQAVEEQFWNEILYAMAKKVYCDTKGLPSTLSNEHGNNTYYWPKTQRSYYRNVTRINVYDFEFG